MQPIKKTKNQKEKSSMRNLYLDLLRVGFFAGIFFMLLYNQFQIIPFSYISTFTDSIKYLIIIMSLTRNYKDYAQLDGFKSTTGSFI